VDNRPRKRRSDGAERGAYKILRTQFLARCAAARTPCCFCNQPIDYSLPHGDPGSPTVEHTVSPAARPDLELEDRLWAPAHSL
jgi:hypothetical protein